MPSPLTVRSVAELRRWIAKARRATLDEESIEARFATTFRAAAWDEAA